MFHISEQYVAKKMSVKHLLNVSSLNNIWSNFLLLVMSKLLRKPVLVRKSLFQLFCHWFLTLSLSFLHRKLATETCFCKVAGKNGKKFLAETFLIYQKGISSMDVFSFLEAYSSAANDFCVRTKRGKEHY